MHTLEMMAKGSSMQVALDGVLQTFTQNGSPVAVVTLPVTGGNNDGTVGIAFSSEDNPLMAGGERANNFVVSTVNVSAAPSISVSASSLAFGSVPVGQRATQTVTITNRGNANLNVSRIAAPAGYAVTPSAPLPTIPPGGNASLSVTLIPTIPLERRPRVTQVAARYRGRTLGPLPAGP
jgi:Abnormal spindle-like microcephaly-assoc'd, ASPM-SPD-2-Hydin